MRILLVVNPQARNGQNPLEEPLRIFEEAGMEVVIDRERRAAEAIRCAGPLDAVVLAGGDGTLHEAAPALADAGLPVGVLPCGTANDLARALRIPVELEGAAKVIVNGSIRPIDVGVVNGEMFFNVAHVGLGAELDDELHEDFKRRWGAMAYGVAAAKTIGKMRSFRVTVRANGQITTFRTQGVTIGNGRYFGGSGIVAEDAEIDDGILRLFALRTSHPMQLVGIVARVFSGRHNRSPNVLSLQSTSFELETRRPMRIRADGIIVGQTPARFSVHPSVLRFFAPPRPEATQLAGEASEPQEQVQPSPEL